MWSPSPLLHSSPPPPPPPPLRRRRSSQRRHFTTTITSSSSPTDPLTAAARLLWGRALPPSPLILAVRTAWSSTWRLLMRQLAPSDPSSGAFSRLPSRFPSVPTFYLQNPQNPNLHLYVGLPCPWAHRTLVVRALRNLEHSIPVSVAVPAEDGGWSFTAACPDKVYGKQKLREVYGMSGYDGRASVPMLWDVEKREVVCNESIEIVKFFSSGVGGGMDLWPPELREEVDEWYRLIYPTVNNGVYRCGFAQSQEAYDTAADELFSTLDKLEAHLSTSRYLCGGTLTLADVCLFTTLIRFDLVYNSLFKCTKKKLVEYPNLHAYTREIYQIPKVAETCNLEAIMEGYFKILFPLNPGGIQPVMPAVCERASLLKPHNRQVLSPTSRQLEASVS